jgi:chemotaxis protein CheX
MSATNFSAELINPFVTASFSVLSMMFNEAPERGTPSPESGGKTHHEVNVVIGIAGDISGTVGLCMSQETANQLVGAMMGAPIEEFDHIATSAVGELGNMISGNGCLQLSQHGFNCDVTPPSVIRGANVEINTLGIPAVVVPLKLELGEIFLTISLASSQRAAA